MTLSNIAYIAIDPAKLDALIEAVERLERRLDGATVKPREEWELSTEHAARIGVTNQTVRNWVKKGLIDSRRVGTRLYVRTGLNEPPVTRRRR